MDENLVTKTEAETGALAESCAQMWDRRDYFACRYRVHISHGQSHAHTRPHAPTHSTHTQLSHTLAHTHMRSMSTCAYACAGTGTRVIARAREPWPELLRQAP